MMRIGELAEQLNLNTQTIRYYERIGLLPAPERTESRYRVYGVVDERRLRFIKSARNLGLTLREVKEVLAFHERGELPCAYVIQTLAGRAEQIGRQVEELLRFKDELELLVKRAEERMGRAQHEREYCDIIESGDDASQSHVQRMAQRSLSSETCCC